MRTFILSLVLIFSTYLYSIERTSFLVPEKCQQYTEKYFSSHIDKGKFKYSFSKLGVKLEAYDLIAGIGFLTSKTLDQGKLFHLATSAMVNCYPLSEIETSLDGMALPSLFIRLEKSSVDIHGVKIKDNKIKIYFDNID